MKFKIDDINNLSDSRQVMESNPNKFIAVFIYILIAIVSTFLIWSWFSEKEIVVNAKGIVRPNSETQAISNIVQGEVKSIIMKNGQEVSKGDVLFEIDSTDLKKEKEQIDEQIDKINKDNDNLDKLNKSIVDDINYFSNSGDEKEYYYKFKNYEAGNKVSLSQKNSISNSKSNLSSEINDLQKLSKSISKGKNYNDKNSVYSDQYESYVSSRKVVNNKIEQLESTKNNIKKEIKKLQKENDKSNLQENKALLKQTNLEIENSKDELSKIKSDALSQVKSSMKEVDKNIDDLDSNLTSIEENNYITKNQNRTTVLSQIQEKIKENDANKKELEKNKEQLQQSINKCVVKSTISGRVNINTNLQKGLVLQTGTVVANIIPKSNNYKVDLTIQAKDIANINVAKDVKYSFEALPYREYGFINGKIESLSPDSKVDSESGLVFFTGEGSLNSSSLCSNKGEESFIKSGMLCEVKIITRKEKMIYYILEKIGIKNE